MKIKFNASPEQVELIKLMGSKNKLVSAEAVEAFAAVIGPIVQEVLLQAGTASMLFTDEPFGEDDNPSYPLDLHYGRTEGYITIWSQTQAGGLASNLIEGYQEIKIQTYKLDSAVSLYKKYASKVRLNAIAKAIEWMGQEILLKQNMNAWSVVTRAVAEASTNSLRHVIRSNTAGVLQVKDFNDILTRVKRLNTAFNGGTPASTPSEGITDFILSPEMKAQIRSFVYEPQNTRGAPNSDESTAVPLPNSVREDIWRNGGATSLYGINITDINELGVNQSYNTLFDNYAGATSFTKLDGTAGAAFNGATEELILGFDASRGGAIRAVITNGDHGAGTVNVQVDDQFVSRSEKIGWYSSIQEGRLVLDSRSFCALIV